MAKGNSHKQPHRYHLVGDGASQPLYHFKHMHGRVHEYEKFVSAFDPCCGSGGMFVSSEKFVEEHDGHVDIINSRCSDGVSPASERAVTDRRYKDWPCASTTTWKLARMNLAIRDFSLSASNGERVGVRCRIPRNADSFRADLHPDLKADFILANPPFNMSDWGGENMRQDVRCFSLSASNGDLRSLGSDERNSLLVKARCGPSKRARVSHWAGVRRRIRSSPVNNANYAWIQHFIHHLSPVGVAGFVMANGSMSTQTSNEGEIRRALIEADLVDCMVALPGQLTLSNN